MSMERATPLEQVQIVPLMLHAQGQVGCLVECGHRTATKRGLLLTPSINLFGFDLIRSKCPHWIYILRTLRFHHAIIPLLACTY